MLAELALTIALAGTPCDLIAEYWPEIAACEQVAVPVAEAGGLVVDQPLVSVPWPDNAQNYQGAVGFRFGPEPTSGYYMIGAIPLCIATDGTITRPGPGGSLRMFPPDHYYAGMIDPDPDEDGLLLGFDNDPCLSPSTRAGFLYVGYSEDAPIPEYGGEEALPETGWDGGKNSFWIGMAGNRRGFVRYDVTQAPEVGTAGHFTYTVSCLAVSTEPPSAYSSVPAPVFRNAASQVQTYTVVSGSHPSATNWCSMPGDVGRSVTVTVNLNSTVRTAIVASSQSGQGTLTYRLPGDPDRYQAPNWSEGYEGRGFIVHSPVFDDFLYVGHTAVWEPYDGVCTEAECVRTYCDGYGIDLGGWFGCMFGQPIDWMDWLQHVTRQVMATPLISAATYMEQIFESYPNSVRSLEGQCGPLADLSGTVLEGMQLDTCILPHQQPVRTIASVGLWLGWIFLIYRMLKSFLATGEPEAPYALNSGGPAKIGAPPR